jgi:hypothetical protein
MEINADNTIKISFHISNKIIIAILRREEIY